MPSVKFEQFCFGVNVLKLSVCKHNTVGEILKMSLIANIHLISRVATLAVEMEQWQVDRSNDTNVDLSAWTDGDVSTCESISVEESVLLRNVPMLPIRGYIHVVLVSESSVLFGPDVPQGMCAENPSLLMTQTYAKDSRVCDPSYPFCEVPQTYKYSGNEEKRSHVFHHFYCKCIIKSCGKFMLMLRPESASEPVSVCETYMI